jgi:hypothetical protein
MVHVLRGLLLGSLSEQCRLSERQCRHSNKATTGLYMLLQKKDHRVYLTCSSRVPLLRRQSRSVQCRPFKKGTFSASLIRPSESIKNSVHSALCQRLFGGRECKLKFHNTRVQLIRAAAVRIGLQLSATARRPRCTRAYHTCTHAEPTRPKA